MGLVSKTFTFAAGATIIASEHNTNLDTLYNLVNGNLENSNIKAGAAIVGSKLDLSEPPAIGGTTPASGAFSTLSASGNTTLNGNVAIGNSSGDSVSVYAATLQLINDLTVAGTFTNLGSVTSVDINGGTIDAVSIGASSSSAGYFSSLIVTNEITEFSTDGTLGGNSDSAIPTEKAVKTYADNITGFSNVLYSWSGHDTDDTDIEYHADQTSLTPVMGGNNTYIFFAGDSSTAKTFQRYKYIHLSGISTWTLNARLWADANDANKEAIFTVDIGGGTLTGSIKRQGDTPNWATASTIDVSSLTPGTTYDVLLKLSNETNATRSYCSAYTITGS